MIKTFNLSHLGRTYKTTGDADARLKIKIIKKFAVNYLFVCYVYSIYVFDIVAILWTII